MIGSVIVYFLSVPTSETASRSSKEISARRENGGKREDAPGLWRERERFFLVRLRAVNCSLEVPVGESASAAAAAAASATDVVSHLLARWRFFRGPPRSRSVWYWYCLLLESLHLVRPTAALPWLLDGVCVVLAAAAAASQPGCWLWCWCKQQHPGRGRILRQRATFSQDPLTCDWNSAPAAD